MEKDMTKGRPLPVILKFMLPLIIGNIFQQLYNMADTIIVGRYVGADALAAVGSTGTIMFLTVGFSQGITAGFSVLTAQRFGAKDAEGVKISVVTVADSQLVFAISEQNFSGCPKDGSCFAIFFQRLQQPLVRTSASPFGA